MAVTHTQRIIKNVGRFHDYFGGTTVLSGDGGVLVVTAAAFDGTQYNLATISIYNRVNDVYVYETDLPIPVEVADIDRLATYVQISYDGKTIAVNVHRYEYIPEALGAVLIFVKGTSWSLRNTLGFIPPVVESPPTEQVSFDMAMSDDANTLAVSAPFYVDPLDQSGLVFIAETTDNWVTYTYISIPGPGIALDRFGYNIAISGDGKVMFAGSRFGPGGESAFEGRLSVYAKDGNVWPTVPNQVIDSPVLRQNEYFAVSAPVGLDREFCGKAIAANFNGSIIVVGAMGAAAAAKPNVYIFEKLENVWQNIDTLQSSADVLDDVQFGYSTSISSSGATIAVGASNQDSVPFDVVGVNYLFYRSNPIGSNPYVKTDEFTAPDRRNFSYGSWKVHISRDGKKYVAGSIQDTDNAEFSGSINVWDLFVASYNRPDNYVLVDGTFTNDEKLPAFDDAVLALNPIAYFKHSESPGNLLMLDSSPNLRHGFYSSNAVKTNQPSMLTALPGGTLGGPGTSVIFDTDADMSRGQSENVSLNLAGNMTVIQIASPTALTGAYDKILCMKGDQTGIVNYLLGHSAIDNTYTFQVDGGVTAKSGAAGGTVGVPILITGRRTSTGIDISLNEIGYGGPSNTTRVQTNLPFVVGHPSVDSAIGTSFFNISHTIIFDYALTDAEILVLVDIFQRN